MSRVRTSGMSVVLAVAGLFGAAVPALAMPSFKVDAVHSTVLFKVKHMNAGYSYGRFNDIDGTFSYDEKNADKMSFDVTVKTESVDTGNAKRDQHLKAPDFFHAKQYPTLSFKSKKIKYLGDETFEVVGDLTCRGVTKEITVKLMHTGESKDPRGGHRCGFETTFTIKRADYGMNYMPGGLGGDVQITVALEGVAK